MKSKWQQIEEERGKPMAEVLKEEFERHQTQSAVSASLGVSQGTINLWLLKAGLEQRIYLTERERAS